MIDFIDDNDIIEYADLIRYLMLAELKDELQVSMESTFFFDKYISSRRNGYSRLNDKISKKRNTLVTC